MLACYEEAMKKKEKAFASAASVFDLFKLSSGSRGSRPVLLLTGDDGPDDRPTVQEEVQPKRTRRPYIHASVNSQGGFHEDVTGIYTPNGLAKQYQRTQKQEPQHTLIGIP
jgi:hypothetical protein